MFAAKISETAFAPANVAPPHEPEASRGMAPAYVFADPASQRWNGGFGCERAAPPIVDGGRGGAPAPVTLDDACDCPCACVSAGPDAAAASPRPPSRSLFAVVVFAVDDAHAHAPEKAMTSASQ